MTEELAKLRDEVCSQLAKPMLLDPVSRSYMQVRCADAFEAAVDALTSWRPISTAPKDGTQILIFNQGITIDKGTWLAVYDTHRGFWGDGEGCIFHPSHWLPLPPAPGVPK